MSVLSLIEIETRSMPIPHSGCLVWLGSLSGKRYGQYTFQRRTYFIHRLAYELRHGAVPAGLVIDHKCRVRSCCNPDHLEPVTATENTRRGFSFSAQNAKKTHCPQGHPYSGRNLIFRGGWRNCRICAEESRRRYRDSLRMRPAA